MMKQRILFMHQASGIGGGSYCLLNVVKAVDETLFEPVVALKSEGPLADELRKLGVEVVIFSQMAAIPYNRGLLQRGSLRAYWAVERSKKALKQLLADNRIDVLYLNNMMLCRYLQPAKECGCKTVVHVREHWPLNEHKRQLEWARHCVYQYADKMIAINHYSASMFPEKEATIVYDWIDMDSRYKPMPLSDIFGEDMTGKKVLLYTGGMQRIKGAYEVVKTFTECLTDQHLRLLVLGFTSELSGSGRTKKIKMLMYKLGIPTYEYKVKMQARKDSRIACIPGVYEIKDIVTQADCMVSYFTIPHANLAMAESIIVGTPVIAARTEEADEYSLGGKLAYLYPMNDVKAFELALMDFVHRPKETLKEKDRERIAEMFLPQRNILNLNNTLKELVS